MAAKLFVLLGFALIAIASAGVVRRDAPQTTDNTVAEIFQNVENDLKKFEAAFLRFFDVENKEQLEAKAKEEGAKVAAQFETWFGKIKTETENIKDNELVKNLREQAEKLGQDLKAKHPETYAEVEKVSKEFENIVKKTKDIAESKEAANIKEAGEKLLKEAGNTLQTIATDVKEAVVAKKN